MGRKIPGKRHKGVKDPDQQRLIRLKSIQNKVNAPPTNPDNQEIPKSLHNFIKLKEKFKTKPKPERKKKSKSELITTDAKLRKKGKVYQSKNSAPAFNQNENESTEAFLHRVNKTVQEVIRESKYEDKYKVKIERDLKTGEVSNVAKKNRDPLKSYVKELKDKNKKKKKDETPKLTKSQKKKQKQIEKKSKKDLEKIYDYNVHSDQIQFGEVVHEPPNLTAPKKVNKANCAPRPGSKDLLLKKILNQNPDNVSTNKKSVFQKIQGAGKINKKGKRKGLPIGVRRQLEKQRSEIVDAYRSLRSKKASSNL